MGLWGKSNRAIEAEKDRIMKERLVAQWEEQIAKAQAVSQQQALMAHLGQLPYPGYPGWPTVESPTPARRSLPTETRTMPVVGFRVWTYQRVFDLATGWKAQLASTGMTNHAWQPGDQTAMCRIADPLELSYNRPRHEAPDQHCQCGFYVLRDLGQVARHVQFGENTIAGAVMGWGRVIQHGEEGWRAQHVRLLALMDASYSAENTAKAQEAATAYGVPVLGRDALKALASEYGDPLDAKTPPAPGE